MSRIIFYDFWDKNPKRKPLANIRSINEIQVVKNKADNLSTGKLENQIILLNGLKYRITHVDKKFKENSIAKHHMTNDEITYEVLVEAIND
ncbi:MAG: hypothetical protein OEY10_06630 [Nitrosopumilus sp.]|nr:hypothetical protein [Nitrosopumilus sp.]MDH5665953.1 hypothetical protein [Nitrosopumilus sp.]